MTSRKRAFAEETRTIQRYHRVELRIPFRDVDSWGLVWHGHYFSFVDHARIDLLKRFSVPFAEFASFGFLMPVVAVQMDLRAAGRADEPIAVDVAILQSRGAMVDTHFAISSALPERQGAVLARGYTRQVFTRVEGGLLYHVPKAVGEGFAAMQSFALGE